MLLEIIRGYVQTLSLRLEDIWIEKEQLREMLLRYGYTPEVLAYIQAKAKADDHWRERAQKHFIAVRKSLGDAAAEDIQSAPPTSVKPAQASPHYNQSSVPEIPANAAR